MLSRSGRWIRLLKLQFITLWYACRDPVTPFRFKFTSALLALYACGPLDLLPDVIPFLGLLDDAVIVPGGVMLLIRLLPAEVRARSEQRAARRYRQGRRLMKGVLVILLIWLLLLVALSHYLLQ